MIDLNDLNFAFSLILFLILINNRLTNFLNEKFSIKNKNYKKQVLIEGMYWKLLLLLKILKSWSILKQDLDFVENFI